MQDPSIPVHKKGVLTSFVNGQSIPIPEKDMVLNSRQHKSIDTQLYL